MALDALVWVPRMYYYLGPSARGLPPDWFLGAVVARDLIVVALMVLVVRSVLRPATDPVRTAGRDDPDWPAPAPTTEPARRRPAGAQLVRTLVGIVVEPVGDQRRRRPQHHHEQRHQQRGPAPHPDRDGLGGEPAPDAGVEPGVEQVEQPEDADVHREVGHQVRGDPAPPHPKQHEERQQPERSSEAINFSVAPIAGFAAQ